MILEPVVYADDRGAFFEVYNEKQFRDSTGSEASFVQDNQSDSVRNVLRGLHYQIQHAQGKLVRVICGEIFDVAVDLRSSSSSFGKWTGLRISADNRKILWIPAGFAHGFLVLSDSASVVYKTTDYHYPEHERCLQWNDPSININWPLADGTVPILSRKDRETGKGLLNADKYP